MTAAELNAHLETGGVVQVTTYARSTVYEQKHAGFFRDNGTELFVRRGKRWDCLGRVDRPYVGIRLGRYVPAT